MNKEEAKRIFDNLIDTHDVNYLSIIMAPSENSEYQDDAINVNMQLVYSNKNVKNEKEDEFKTL